MRIVFGLLVLSMSAAPLAGDEPVLKLSPKLRAALVAEMAAVKAAVADLSGALATGDWRHAGKRARDIRDSYILKQKLSASELAELERALPPDFQQRDAQFHRHAEALAHAAERGDGELAGFYLGRMIEGCTGCHSRYAAHALPGFRPVVPAAGHSH